MVIELTTPKDENAFIFIQSLRCVFSGDPLEADRLRVSFRAPARNLEAKISPFGRNDNGYSLKWVAYFHGNIVLHRSRLSATL
jgi:hypothetical protein